eukprot:8440796-Pyramimonas_sp.AAC.1
MRLASPSGSARIPMGTDKAALNRCYARSSLDCWSASLIAEHRVITAARPASMVRGSATQTPGAPG